MFVIVLLLCTDLPILRWRYIGFVIFTNLCACMGPSLMLTLGHTVIEDGDLKRRRGGGWVRLRML